ncbi:sigma factor-like helix-turn-helix DNA-binding protein [Streptomyces javensis]
MTPVRAHPRHAHDDAPDTSVEFRRIAALPDGPSKEALGGFAPLSLDAEPRGADGFGLMDTLGSTEPSYERVVRRESLKPWLRKLPEREREIPYPRFFCDETQSRIADRLGISQMQVSRLISATCARLGRQAGARAA